jgi:hypothetical protein
MSDEHNTLDPGGFKSHEALLEIFMRASAQDKWGHVTTCLIELSRQIGDLSRRLSALEAEPLEEEDSPLVDIEIETGEEAVDALWWGFWLPTLLTRREGAEITLGEAIKLELADYHFLLQQVPIVYDHVTGGRISKATTYAKDVCVVSDDYVTGLVEREVAEALEAFRALRHKLFAQAMEASALTEHLQAALDPGECYHRGRDHAYADATTLLDNLLSRYDVSPAPERQPDNVPTAPDGASEETPL